MTVSPPTPLPENLWGDRWRFAATPAGTLVETFCDRPIPILQMPESLFPLKLGLASTLMVPGVVIDGGRQAMRLARWVEQVGPIAIRCQPGPLHGLMLTAEQQAHWVVATFSDPEVVVAAEQFEQRKQVSQGLHFLLIQPDDTGITYSGIWLLKADG
jgi:hypothetical protein